MRPFSSSNHWLEQLHFRIATVRVWLEHLVRVSVASFIQALRSSARSARSDVMCASAADLLEIISKSWNSNPGATSHPRKLYSPRGLAACQYPAGTTHIG